MSELTLTGLLGGVLHGRLAPGAPPPPLVLVARGQVLGPVRLQADGEGWALSVGVPAAVLDEGVMVLTVQEAASGTVRARYPIAAGQGVGEDVLVALAGLEADLAALRRAFLTAMADPPLTRAERPLLLAEAVQAMAALVPALPKRVWQPPCPLPRRRARRLDPAAPPRPGPGRRR